MTDKIGSGSEFSAVQCSAVKAISSLDICSPSVKVLWKIPSVICAGIFFDSVLGICNKSDLQESWSYQDFMEKYGAAFLSIWNLWWPYYYVDTCIVFQWVVLEFAPLCNLSDMGVKQWQNLHMTVNTLDHILSMAVSRTGFVSCFFVLGHFCNVLL